MTKSDNLSEAAAYGGRGWSPRKTSAREEIGTVWAACGLTNEWARLRAVLLHRPGSELEASADPDAVQMLAPLDPRLAQAEHDALAQAFLAVGVAVHHVAPESPAPPNLMFVADLMFMTPEGVILARPASSVRAGEERLVARRLTEIGIPILRSLCGTAVFEGADAAWLDPHTVLLSRGLRTNAEGVAQVTSALKDLGVKTIPVELPAGAMHLMGLLRFADRDLAIAWPGRTPAGTITALRECGYTVIDLPDEERETRRGMALNFVTLGPRRILMPAGNPAMQSFFERHDIECLTVTVGELVKAAGGIGCLSGILWRDIE